MTSTTTRHLWLAALVAVVPTTAHALKPARHADITRRSCERAGLPEDLCKRAATENYNTDAREWDDLSAHAQISTGETACEAADHTARRLWLLGYDLRLTIAAVRLDATQDRVGIVGEKLGRALHTLQDNCAHHGMPNPQHAWFSLADFCDGSSLSPDLQEDAATCARAETDAVMREIAAAIQRAGIGPRLGALSCPEDPFQDRPSQSQRPLCDNRFLPSPFAACQFLGEADEWDGTDRTWENEITVPALRDAFLTGLAGNPPRPSICGGDERVLSRAASAPMVDVSGGTPSCVRAHLVCLGGADLDDNPFADDDLGEDDPEASGCSAGGAGGLGLVPLLALGLVGRRRPRRS